MSGQLRGNIMAGYFGYSMSNNAVEAYENGSKPFSKWTKADILELIEDENLELNCSIDKLKKVPVKILKEICLKYSSWHHTSNHYNKTDFYSIDYDSIENLTDEKLDGLIEEYRKEKANAKAPVEEKWECTFLEWSGTRKHPTAKAITEIGIVKGNWFYRSNGTKKSIYANGFEFVRKIED